MLLQKSLSMTFVWIFAAVTVVSFCYLLLYMRVAWSLRRRYGRSRGGRREIERRMAPYRYGSVAVGVALGVCLVIVSTM